MKKYGDRQSVYDGLSKMTRGGLMKEDLLMSKNGKIVSKKKSDRAKENYAKYGFKKYGEFGAYYRLERELGINYPKTTSIVGLNYVYTFKKRK